MSGETSLWCFGFLIRNFTDYFSLPGGLMLTTEAANLAVKINGYLVTREASVRLYLILRS